MSFYAKLARICALLLTLTASTAWSMEPCNRKVGENDRVNIDPRVLSNLQVVHITRDEILSAMRETATPETGGCWSGSTGNFDGQLLSVGIAQWNFGQKSLQPLLVRFKHAFDSDPKAFKATLDDLMPTNGNWLFSTGCLRSDVTSECLQHLQSVQSPLKKGQLEETFRKEIDRLFESDAMVQIQADEFVKLLTAAADDMKRLFQDHAISPKQIKWAIDLKVQQSNFPNQDDINRARNTWIQLSPSEKKTNLKSIVRWYEGLCSFYDQGGVRLDCQYNVQRWNNEIDHDHVSEEVADLLIISHLRSRVAKTKSGLFEADTFQRRAKIAFGTGSVHGQQN